MEVVFTPQNNTLAQLSVTIVPADYQAKVNDKIKKYAQTANLKGFRAGKAPIAFVQKMVGKNMLADEVYNMAITAAFDYISKNNIEYVAEPMPNFETQKEQDFGTQKDFTFDFTIGMASPFEISPEALELVKYDVLPKPEVIEETIKNIQSQQAGFNEVEISQAGDFLYGKIHAVEGDFSLEFSAIPLKQVKENVVSKFIGLSKDAEIPFVISETFEDPKAAKYLLGIYDEEKLESHKDIPLVFVLDKVQRQQVNELNPEFFKQVFPENDIETVEAFKEKVAEVIAENYKKEASKLLEGDVREEMVQRANFELPTAFLKNWLKVTQNAKELTDEKLEEEFKFFEDDLRWVLVQRKLMKSADIKVEQEDVIERAKEMLSAQMRQYGMYNEETIAGLDTMARKMLAQDKGKQYDQILNVLYTEKVVSKVLEVAKITEKQVSFDEFQEIIKERNKKYEVKFGQVSESAS